MLTVMLKGSSSARIWTQIAPKFSFAITTTVNYAIFRKPAFLSFCYKMHKALMHDVHCFE